MSKTLESLHNLKTEMEYSLHDNTPGSTISINEVARWMHTLVEILIKDYPREQTIVPCIYCGGESYFVDGDMHCKDCGAIDKEEDR
jgi:hypothetical protein